MEVVKMKKVFKRFSKLGGKFFAVVLALSMMCPTLAFAAEETPENSGAYGEITNVVRDTPYEEDGKMCYPVEFDVEVNDGPMTMSYDDRTYLALIDAYNTPSYPPMSGSRFAYEVSATSEDSSTFVIQLRNNGSMLTQHVMKANGSIHKEDNLPLDTSARYYFRILPSTSKLIRVRIIIYSW